MGGSGRSKDRDFGAPYPKNELTLFCARQRTDELRARLQKRLTELEQERKLSSQPPVVIRGASVLPAGLPERLRGDRTDSPDAFARETARAECAGTVTVTKYDVLTVLNKPGEFVLALVYVRDTMLPDAVYIRSLFVREPDFGATTVKGDLDDFVAKGEKPA
jgi:hypothetical protein